MHQRWIVKRFEKGKSPTTSQSLSLPHMRNGVHFFLLTDIAYPKEYEFKRIGWFLIEGAETRFQAPLQSYIESFLFQNYLIPYIPCGK